MAYKIQALIEDGYDFKKLYPEKQEAVRQQTGLDFYLESVVNFLQKQTNNFTIDNPIAHDLDNAIYGIVEKYEKESGSKEMPTPTPEKRSETEFIESFLYYPLDEDDKRLVDSLIFVEDDRINILEEILERNMLDESNIPFIEQLIKEYKEIQ